MRCVTIELKMPYQKVLAQKELGEENGRRITFCEVAREVWRKPVTNDRCIICFN